MITIPESYEQARERFRSRLPALQAAWPRARLEVHTLPASDGDRDLSIDSIRADGLAGNERLLVFTTGEHGIEGYLGSAMLELFLEEYLPRLNPQTTGILLVHAINPWGMKHWQRNNAASVDLNRNFIGAEFAALEDYNPGYSRLASFLSPAKRLGPRRLESLLFMDQTIHALVRFGARGLREAALNGQYRRPKGIYYGGQGLQVETGIVMGLYADAFNRYEQIVHLDIHTGYGPRNQMTLVTSPHERMNAVEITKRYGVPRVAACNPDEFYNIQGDMIDWEYSWMAQNHPSARFFAATCEFGTYGDSTLAALRSLRTTVFKNQVNHFGASPADQAWVDAEYRELYLPSEPEWFAKAQTDARQTFEGVLKAEGFV